MSRPVQFLPQEKRKLIVEKYSENSGSIKSLMKDFNLSRWEIRKTLIKEGVKLKSPEILRKIYSVNTSFFKNTSDWTEKQAYFYGWLYSDGYCSGNHIGFGLNKSDYRVLEKLNTLIQNTGPITYCNRQKKFIIRGKEITTKETCILNIYSKEISSDVRKLGIKVGKSEILGYPDWLSMKLAAPFLRGVFEGDGSFCANKHDCSVSLICCESFINGVNKILSEIGLDLSFKQFGKFYSNGSITTFRISGRRKCVKFLNFIYDDHNGLILDRKYKKYCEMFEMSNNFTRNFKNILTEDKKAQQIINKNFKNA